jgi:hypothetical protein
MEPPLCWHDRLQCCEWASMILCIGVAQSGAEALVGHPTVLPCATIAGMDRRERLTKELEEAERELDAAKTLPALNAAAKKLQRAV